MLNSRVLIPKENTGDCFRFGNQELLLLQRRIIFSFRIKTATKTASHRMFVLQISYRRWRKRFYRLDDDYTLIRLTVSTFRVSISFKLSLHLVVYDLLFVIRFHISCFLLFNANVTGYVTNSPFDVSKFDR